MRESERTGTIVAFSTTCQSQLKPLASSFPPRANNKNPIICSKCESTFFACVVKYYKYSREPVIKLLNIPYSYVCFSQIRQVGHFPVLVDFFHVGKSPKEKQIR